jgi:hypothetical protein
LGGGTLEHLGLIISDASFAMIAPTTEAGPTIWKTPQAPGRASANTDGTAAQTSTARHIWEEDVQTYQTYTSVQQALKKHIISVFEPMCLDILNDNVVAYTSISARDMLDHLFETYGNITTVDLDINFEKMRRAWDPQQPVESLFKQIQDCAKYSQAGGVLIGHPQQINVGYANIFATGNFMSACRRWNEKHAIAKTWTQFKTHFAAAHRQHKVHLDDVDCAPTKNGHILQLENPPRIRRRGRSRPTLNRLDGKIPGEIQQMKLICHSLLCL